jgi:hypothetical protein
MKINGANWLPSLVDGDKCRSAFIPEGFFITTQDGIIPYYKIMAYKDKNARTDGYSENIFRIQVGNVTKEGTYNVSGSYKDHFGSHALFSVHNADGTSKLYVSLEDKPSITVEVEEIIPIEGASVTGISGVLYGTLYNEADHTDTMTIEAGKFFFSKMNWFDFEHCTQ